MSLFTTCPDIKFPHAFLSREGGVSEGLYTSLNCGPGSNDDPASVTKNRQVAAALISGKSETPLLTCYQIHSATVIEATTDWGQDRPKADALVSKQKGLILGILTADCTPVLFADDKAGVIGAAHAGWQGALNGVLNNTVEAMEKLGAARDNIYAAIGPTIHQDSYEVKSDFRTHFLDIESGFSSFFTNGKDKDHYQFDLPSFVEAQLTSSGIKHIWNTEIDTYKSPDHFSYRRTTHRKEPDYGRQVSAIMMPVY